MYNRLLQFLVYGVLIALPCCSCGQEDVSQTLVQSSWLQYGHQTNWRTGLKLATELKLSAAWNIEIGEGRSQVVGVGDEIYATTGSSEWKDGKNRLTMRTVAIDAVSGKEIWSHRQASTMHDDQEAFGGAQATPQSTPAIVGNRLVTISFTGQLTCLNRSNGEKVWELDLVEELGGEPVQFGFSASPVFDPKQPDRIYVLAAGNSAGFFCLNIADGSVIWKSACQTPAYATPVRAEFAGVRQWVVVTENEVLGIATDSGEQLWRHEWAETGLTNVPAPLVVDESRLLISGQGCQGVRCLEISKRPNEWVIEQQWFIPRVEFFYTNWAMLSEQVVVGCTDKYLAVIDTSKGNILGRFRGFGDGNLALAGRKLLVVDGKGVLYRIGPQERPNATMKALVLERKLKLLDARCWTPLSVVGDRILVRGDDRLICLKLSGDDSIPLENILTAEELMEFQDTNVNQEKNPVEQIFHAFETSGKDAALEIYGQLRAENKLDETARLALADVAQQQGLSDVAKLIITQAQEDFPQSRSIAAAAEAILGK